MKVLHILYQSLPQISGSSIRSRDLLMSQKEIGLDPVAVTSPFQSSLKDEEIIYGVRYIRTEVHQNETISDRKKSTIRRIIRFFKIFSFYKNLKQIIRNEKPEILHAHAMFFCGLPAIFLGNKFHLPVVYEVRSLWMLNKKGKKGAIGLWTEKVLYSIELFVMRRATLVVAINDALKDELVAQKINETKISVIGNAVNTTLIDSLKQKISGTNLTGPKLNFGYIGTLTPHEGIDLLIEAFAEVNKEFPKSELFIFGGGVEENRIKTLAKNLENVRFQGAIEPHNVHKAFESIDIIVNPRYKNKLTDSVTPLKPLEAMAYEKIFIGSDVGGIKELITHAFNGYLFDAGSRADLINVMIFALRIDDEKRNLILNNALQYVYNEKSWLKNAGRYKSIYNELIIAHNEY